jgi:hypothetical protein
MNKQRLLARPVLRLPGISIRTVLKNAHITFYANIPYSSNRFELFNRFELYALFSNPHAFDALQAIANNSMGNFKVYSKRCDIAKNGYASCILGLEVARSIKTDSIEVNLVQYLLSLSYITNQRLIMPNIIQIISKV